MSRNISFLHQKCFIVLVTLSFSLDFEVPKVTSRNHFESTCSGTLHSLDGTSAKSPSWVARSPGFPENDFSSSLRNFWFKLKSHFKISNEDQMKQFKI